MQSIYCPFTLLVLVQVVLSRFPCMQRAFSPYRIPSLFITCMERDEIINICILSVTPFKCRPSTVQIIMIPPMSSAKITDVKRDVFDSAQSGLNYLTSDQGVKVSDTDNW